MPPWSSIHPCIHSHIHAADFSIIHSCNTMQPYGNLHSTEGIHRFVQIWTAQHLKEELHSVLICRGQLHTWSGPSSMRKQTHSRHATNAHAVSRAGVYRPGWLLKQRGCGGFPDLQGASPHADTQCPVSADLVAEPPSPVLSMPLCHSAVPAHNHGLSVKTYQKIRANPTVSLTDLLSQSH